ncbi:MAG: hypothetical protein ACI9TY_000161 [Alphaproteobacteria bacterium]|jgi:hypothetical protein
MEKPISFFKYTGAHGGRLLLENQTLKWSRPSEFNDPFDCHLDLVIDDLDYEFVKNELLRKARCVFDSTVPLDDNNFFNLTITSLKSKGTDFNSIQKMLEPLFAEMFESLPNIVQKYESVFQTFMSAYKLLCLSSVVDDNLMWSHYADSHKGCAFEFRSSDQNSPYNEAKAVSYPELAPVYFDANKVVNLMCGDFSEDYLDMIHKCIYTKSRDWDYEKEWRVSLGDGRTPSEPFEFLPFGERELHGVYLGCKMPDADYKDQKGEKLFGKTSLVKLIREKYPQAKIYQAKKIYGKRVVEFEELKVK